MGSVFHGNGLLFLITLKSTQNTVHPSRGVARIFQRGGVTAGTPSGDCRLYKVYTTALPRVSAGSVVLIIAA